MSGLNNPIEESVVKKFARPLAAGLLVMASGCSPSLLAVAQYHQGDPKNFVLQRQETGRRVSCQLDLADGMPHFFVGPGATRTSTVSCVNGSSTLTCPKGLVGGEIVPGLVYPRSGQEQFTIRPSTRRPVPGQGNLVRMNVLPVPWNKGLLYMRQVCVQ